MSEDHPLHAAILAQPAPRKTGVWLGTGTSVRKPYPCACRLGDRRGCVTTIGGDYPPCRCWGRTDGLDKMPPHCCAGRAARMALRRQLER